MNSAKHKIGIVFGGSGCLRQEALLSARNIYELLLEMPAYTPELLFFVGGNKGFYKIPVHLLYKHNIDDIRTNILQWEKTEAPNPTGGDLPVRINNDQLKNLVDAVWIALYERPGTDGQLQMSLEALELAHNTSDIAVMNLLQHKIQTNDLLKDKDFLVQPAVLVEKDAYEARVVQLIKVIEDKLNYPFAVEAEDEPCLLTAVLLKNRQDLLAWLELTFRDAYSISDKEKKKWQLAKKPDVDAFILKGNYSIENSVFSSPFILGVYTSEDDDSMISYTFSVPMVATEDQWNVLEIKSDVLDTEAILSQLYLEAERLVRILDIRGYALINGQLAVNPSGKADMIIERVDSLPLVTQSAPFSNLKWQNNNSQAQIIDKIITFGIQRLEDRKKSALKSVVMESENTGEAKIENTVSQAVEPMVTREANPANIAVEEQMSFFETLKSFVTSKVFLKNLGAIAGFLILCFILLNLWMRSYTRHNSYLVVDNYIGQQVEDATDRAKSKGLEMVVLERQFESGKTPGEIYQQIPKPEAHIKEGRKIYVNIYTNSQLEFELPSTIGNDNYELYARSLRKHPYQLQTIIKERKFNAKLEDKTILYMYYDGKKITPSDLKKGVKVLQGSTLEFVISTRHSNYANVPDLVCQKFDAVEFMLSNYDLQIGEVVGSKSGFVVRQEPAAGKRLQKGGKVKIYTATSRPAHCAN